MALTRVTVNLTESAAAAAQALSDRTGLSRTDVINRALKVYALVDRLAEDGTLCVVRDGEQERIHFL